MAQVVMLTDFGTRDPYVGIMRGVMSRIAPAVRVQDLTHGVPPQQVLVGSLWLAGSLEFFPEGTLFLCVVDPGVGSERRVLASAAGSWLFVAPDNGLLSAVWQRYPAHHTVSVENPAMRLPTVSATFHGRDIMAPAAAYLALGRPIQELGPPLEHPTRLHLPVARRQGDRLVGEVLYVDHFGNAITSLTAKEVQGHDAVWVAGSRLPHVRTYAHVPPGQPLALVGSVGRLEISVNGGSAARSLGLEPGTRVSLPLPAPPAGGTP